MSVRSNVPHVILITFVLGLLFPTAARAQERVWLDVNFGVALPTDKEFSTHLTRTIFAEPADFDVDYSFPRGPVFDGGAGFMLTPQIGFGISASRSKHEDVPVLSARIPHPAVFNNYGSDSVAGDTKLARTESALHIQAMFVVAESDHSRFRVFGGPTYMRVKNETVDDFHYTQSATIVPLRNTIEITSYDIGECECTGWGFHVGGDYSYFFTPNVGVGGIVRFTRVKVEPIDFSLQPIELNAGGVAIGGGLRIKF